MSLARPLLRALPRRSQQVAELSSRHAVSAPSCRCRRRNLSTVPQNPHIYTAPHPTEPKTHIFTLLPTEPPTPSLALGTAPTPDPDVDDFRENGDFLRLLHVVVGEHAAQDPAVQAQAAAFASQAGSATAQLTHGAAADSRQQQRRQQRRQDGDSGSAVSKLAAAAQHKISATSAAGGASAQGGIGSGGRGGFIHVQDERNPPDWGRIAWPEDILGSLELDGQGGFVDGTGRYQASGTYRILTREGMLGISKFMRDKLRERMAEIERDIKAKSA